MKKVACQFVIKQRKLRGGIFSACLAIASVGAGYNNSSVAAQDEEEGPELEEIQITGSRIVRRDYQANSPIVTVDAENLETRSGLNVESYLNQLPNYNPASSPVTTQSDIQVSAVNSVGIATVSLRGFGPNRNLVLLDGKRPTPTNALMVTDLNGIPSALVERVEIISGGASAVYGADAIGGVTNFILRKNFEGVEFDLQRGVTEAGDGDEYRLSAVMGTDFSDGRGNITFAVEQYNREAALERNRDFYTKSWVDPNQPSDDLFTFGSAGYNGAFDFNNPDLGTVRALFPKSPLTTNQTPLTPFFHNFRFGPNGEIWTLNGDNLSKYESIGGVYNEEFAKRNAFDTTVPQQGATISNLKYNNTDAYASAPQERRSFFVAGNYDLTDSINFYTQASFSESDTSTLIYSTHPIFGWESRVDFNPKTDSPLDPALNWKDPALVSAALANPGAYKNPNFIPTGTAGAQHPVPNELAVLLMSRPNPSGQWATELFPARSMGHRTTTNTNEYWQLETGVRFDIPFKDWTGEVYFSQGEANSYNVGNGNLSLARWRKLVNSPDWGRNAELRYNQASDGASSANFGTVAVKCTSGLYDTFFKGEVPMSADCLYVVDAPLQSRTQNQQEVLELNFQGGIVDLPAGEMRGALGYSGRDNAAQFNPDILASTRSIDDAVVGIYPTAYLDASTNVKDFYGELLVPVLSDLPMLKNLELELGFRASSYEHSDDTETFKILTNIEVNDAFRMRGGFNRANRAPNLGEQFLNLQEIYTGTAGQFIDPCGLRSNATYGAGGILPDPVLRPGEAETQLAAGQTNDGAYSTYLICRAQMGAAGASTYYAGDAVGGTSDFSSAWRFQQGNLNVKSEVADTWSFGFVLAGSAIADNPWISGLTGSIDWWKVDISDAIQQYSPDYAGYLCYGTKIAKTEAEAAQQAATRACQNTPRSLTTGGALGKLVEYDNQATIETSGYDVALNWFSELGDIGVPLPGGFGINVQATILDYYRTKQSPANFDVVTEWKGSLGPDLSGTNPGAYDYRLFTSFNYSLDKLNVSLRWRYLPEVITANEAAINAKIENNKRVAGGGEGVLISYTPTTSIPAADYSVFDLSMNYQFSEKLSLRAGIDNLLDKQPSLTGQTYGVGVTEYNNVCTSAAKALGCVNPTGPSLATTGSGATSAGYYDVLGRRWYMGIKATF
jgi:iron complex outermembrane recepter protein